MKKNILFLFVLFTFYINYGQITLYSEDFTGQQGAGATGSDPTVNIAGVDWDIDFSSANLSTNYRFRVRNINNNPLFESRNVGSSIWLSPEIDISNNIDIAFTIDATQGNNTLDNLDTLTTQYRVDGGVWTTAATNGSLSNDYGAVQISQTGLNGNTLELRITSVNDADSERHRFDNILVTGSCATPINPTIFDALNGTNTSADLNWNLDDCNEEYLIIAKENSTVTFSPSGDGSAYTSDANFGDGTEVNTDEFVVYKGNLDTETISALVYENTYFFTIFGRNGTTWSSGTEVTYTSNYCTSVGTRTDFDTNTTLVSFGEINNNTVVDDGAPYHDYTALSNSIALGASENLTVNLDTDGNFAVYCYVWIDWNRDGDFDDAGETYDFGDAVNTDNGPTSNSPLSITAPIDAELGDTRMRVVSQYYFNTIPTNGPCDGSTDGEVEDYTVTITPANDYVYNNGWTPSDPNNVASTLSNILVEAGTANFSTNTNCNTFTVNPEGSVTIENGVTLTIENEMVLESSSTQYSSLILDGSITGNVRYERHINIAAGSGTTTTANDLISPPLIGQTFGDFRAANPNILSGTIGGNPAFLFGPFNPATETYINYFPSDDSSILNAGNGYRTGSTDNGTYTFTGTIETGNVNTAVTFGGASNWNLIGNPYPSYINVQSFLNNVNNSSLMDINAVGMYGYDGTAEDGWVIYNLATTNSSTVITPGQGFFVDASASGNMVFTANMRATGSSDDFIAGRNSNPLVYLKLKVSNNENSFKTDFYFNDDSSLSLDPGYDAKVWNNTPPDFSIYSNLVENNNGEAMTIQSLHSNDLFNVTIPLGVNTTNNSEIEFSIAESTIPDTIDIYLEDTVESTLTLLTDSNYSLTPISSINGTGRFYLRLVDNQLNLNEIELESLNIYTDNSNKSIVVEGLMQQQTQFQLFDIQGRSIKNLDLQLNSNQQIIDTSDLTSGIYIVQLRSLRGTNVKTKKVIIK